ncbi:MAG: tripartite tricarboxylate transporter permease [Planctomycetales bacterium]|nr:tripartite tricarboxylate transporter permease [Planctomycetales bacterium]MCC0025155.1 tripartite tricarboxylate transporter permease [Hyphomicrobiaceae bacterium]
MDGLLIGVANLLTIETILAVAIGCGIGIFVGAMPGLGSAVGIALMVPLTYSLSPTFSVVMLAALYMGSEYGGSVSAILLNTPGTPSATATMVDGYPMSQKGQARLALGVSLSSSAVGGLIGGLALVLLAQPLVGVALRFGPPAYFAVGVFGLSMVAALAGSSLVKGLVVACLGLMLVTVGSDPISGYTRFTFGSYELIDGIPVVAVMIGLFAVSEAFFLVEKGAAKFVGDTSLRHLFLSREQWRNLLPTMLRGGVIGTLIGILPGVGSSVGGWFSYTLTQRLSSNPEDFGKGEVKGVAAPESANNATVGGSLIPLLTLGIPGSPTTAMLMGTFFLHGLQPGPALFQNAPDIVYTLMLSLFAAVAFMYVLGSFALPLCARVIALPNHVLAILIVAMAAVGVFALRSLMFDVWVMLGFGVIGYFLRKFGFPLPPMILAVVLGPMIEANFRRSLLLSQGDYNIFFEDGIAFGFLALTAVFVLAIPALKLVRKVAFQQRNHHTKNSTRDGI